MNKVTATKMLALSKYIMENTLVRFKNNTIQKAYDDFSSKHHIQYTASKNIYKITIISNQKIIQLKCVYMHKSQSKMSFNMTFKEFLEVYSHEKNTFKFIKNTEIQNIIKSLSSP